jgi:hypothetical protein
MPRGGARTRSGPAPDPNALRRERDIGDWVVLPASGGLDKAPTWPLVDQSVRESGLWSALWLDKPQAFMWKRLGLEIEVALYVRRLTEAEQPDSAAALSTLVRQMGDSLGLTTAGLRANRWRIAGDEGDGVTQQSTGQATRRAATSSRSRLRVVPPAASE